MSCNSIETSRLVRVFFAWRKRVKCYLIKYVEKLTKGFGGTAQGPFIKILSKYKDDAGLLEHEKAHVRQWYALLAVGVLISTLLTLLVSPSLWPLYVLTLFLHQSLYKFIRPYRRWCEVQAYRKQIAVGGYTSNEFAVTTLVEKYDLNLSADDVKALLFD